MTERQFKAWEAWLRAQWNEPSRTDHYLMQIAAHLGKTSLGKQRVNFEWTTPQELTMEEATVRSQARWFMAIEAAGMPIQNKEQSLLHRRKRGDDDRT